MLMTKIFNVTVNDVYVNVDTHCDSNCDHDDDQDNDSDTVCDINERTTHQVHQSLFYIYGVDTNYNNINTIRNNNFNVRDVTACDGGISHNGVDTIPDTDFDLVNS